MPAGDGDGERWGEKGTGQVIQAPRQGAREVAEGVLQAGGSCLRDSQEERVVCTSAWRASPWRSTARGPAIDLPMLCLLHSVCGLGEIQLRGIWQGSLWGSASLQMRPLVACICGGCGMQEVAGGALIFCS